MKDYMGVWAHLCSPAADKAVVFEVRDWSKCFEDHGKRVYWQLCSPDWREMPRVPEYWRARLTFGLHSCVVTRPRAKVKSSHSCPISTVLRLRSWDGVWSIPGWLGNPCVVKDDLELFSLRLVEQCWNGRYALLCPVYALESNPGPHTCQESRTGTSQFTYLAHLLHTAPALCRTQNRIIFSSDILQIQFKIYYAFLCH